MIFRPFYYYDLGCASYLLGCGSLGKAAVVDPRTDDGRAERGPTGVKKAPIS